MRIYPTNIVFSLRDEYGDPLFNQAEADVLLAAGIKTVADVFQTSDLAPDPFARRVQKLLDGIQQGENSRAYRLQELRDLCEGDPSKSASVPHTETISYNKLPNTYDPAGDGYLPRRARGVITEAASGFFTGSSEIRRVFDNHHRGGGYGVDDFGSWDFD